MLQTLTELNTLLHGVTVTMSGYSDQNVRIAYQGNQQPAWNREDDVIFIYIQPVEDDYAKNIDTVAINPTPISGEPGFLMDVNHAFTRVLAVDFQVYGPNSYDTCVLLKYKIGTPAIRNVLAVQQAYPLPHIPQPKRVPYLFNRQWFDRSDLQVKMNVKSLIEEFAYSFADATINLYNQDGQFGTIVVDEGS